MLTFSGDFACFAIVQRECFSWCIIDILTWFTRLQDEYLSMQREVKTTIEEGRIVQEKYKSMYEACSQKISEQQAELDECQSRVIFP